MHRLGRPETNREKWPADFCKQRGRCSARLIRLLGGKGKASGTGGIFSEWIDLCEALYSKRRGTVARFC